MLTQGHFWRSMGTSDGSLHCRPKAKYKKTIFNLLLILWSEFLSTVLWTQCYAFSLETFSIILKFQYFHKILLVRNSLPTASRWLSLHTRKAYLLSEHQKPPHCLIIGLHIISLAILHGLNLGIQRLQGSLVFSSSENELQTFSRTNVDIHNQIQTDDFNSRNKE